MPDITGGCLCGRVRYTLTGEPAFQRDLPLPKLLAIHRLVI